jgi:1-deoxy-D-xylulose-5-phosphate reductoisomerase
MGAKISIDSATMMNKGLELIEAHHIFGMDESRLDVLVHTQSIIHSLVAFRDGSLIAQLGEPDMRIPIAYALGWPERLDTTTPRLDLDAIGQLTFEKADPQRFPALRVARDAMRTGGNAANIMNAANEVAVAAFLDHRIGFLDIAALVEATLELIPTSGIDDLEQVFAFDQQARQACAGMIDRRTAP